MKLLLEKINSLYNLNISKITKINKGFLGKNYYLVKDNKKEFFLKQYHHNYQDENKIIEIHNSLDFFANYEIPVIKPLSNKNNTNYFRYDNYFYAIFPYITGKQIKNNKLDNDSVSSLGHMLAKIHLAGKNANIKIKGKFEIKNTDIILKEINQLLEFVYKKNNFNKIALDIILLKKDLLLENEHNFKNIEFVSDHLVHGDYTPSNVFFDDKKNVKWVFDFEKVSYCPRVFEVYRSLFYGIMSSNFSTTDFYLGKKYLDSYSNLYQISFEELENGLQIYFLKSISRLWLETEHIINNNKKIDHFLLEDYQRIKYFAKNFDLFLKIIK